MTTEELHHLIDALLDADIEESDFLRLEAELHVNSESRRLYYERLKMDTLLTASSQEAGARKPRIAESIWKRHGLAAAAAAITIVCSAALGWILAKQPGDTSIAALGSQASSTKEPTALGFGIVTEAAEAVWANKTQIGRGDLVPGGALELRSGIVKLELFSGVNIVIEGNAEFEITSPMEMRVERGRIGAVVPEQAHGFRIVTNSGELVDLGTEFSIDISPDHTDLHVLDGEVEWHPKSATGQTMVKGESLRWSASGQREPILGNGRRMEQIDHELASRRVAKRKKWQASSDKLASDPRVLAYYPIHSSVGKMLIDENGREQHGTIIRASSTTDRWDHPGAALNFSQTGSRARVIIPGEHRSMTFLCWAKINSLDLPYNSLFLTDGHETGEPHWQLLNDGRLFFSVKRRQTDPSIKLADKHIFLSPPVWTPAQSGKWMQIATTYDVDARRVRHFIDGQRVSQETIPEDYLVETVNIGAASIGNWGQPRYRTDPEFVIRNLNGSIDEFVIFSSALSESEIHNLYEIGKP